MLTVLDESRRHARSAAALTKMWSTSRVERLTDDVLLEDFDDVGLGAIVPRAAGMPSSEEK